MASVRSELLLARTRIGADFFYETGRRRWKQQAEKLEIRLQLINTKVQKLNMVVPALHMQIIPYTTERVLRKSLQEYEQRAAAGNLPKLVELPAPQFSYDPVPVSYDAVSLRTVFSEIRALFGARKSQPMYTCSQVCIRNYVHFMCHTIMV